MPGKIYILDEIVAGPAACAALRDGYFERYAPGAKARGMHFEGGWRTPALELPDRPATLYFLWSVAGVGDWWAMRLGAARANPELDVAIEGTDEKAEWWAWVDSQAESRKRSFMVDLVPGDADV
jgi:hypothetical protein